MDKRFFFFIFSSMALFAGEEEVPKSYWDVHPIHIGSNAICNGSASIENKHTGKDDGHLVFRKANAYATILVPISHFSYFFPRVEWNTFTMDWNKNPKFNTTQFYYVQFGLTFYTIAVDKWRWIMRADWNFDQEHFDDINRYCLWSGLIWGTYQIHRKWHYHIGATGYKGLESEQIYPIIGVDFAPNKRWFFQLLFPINYSVEYNLTDRWRFAIRARPLKERFRAGKNQPQPQSVFSYSSTGGEFNIHYEIKRRLEFEIYGGYNFGGTFYIKDKYSHNSLYTNLGGSPYGGATLDIGF
jgi:hypothetical protein